MYQTNSRIPLMINNLKRSNLFVFEPLSESTELENVSVQYFGMLDFFMPLNFDESEINNYDLYFKIISKPFKISLLGCLSGITISSLAIPFPFSTPLILAFTGFVLTLIIYRLRLYKNL